MEWIMNWWWATVLGPLVLGGAIAYALLMRRRLSSGEKVERNAETRRVYREGSRQADS